MIFVKTLRELNKKDSATAGGKGAALGEMVKIGIPVPDGFVVTTHAFETFLIENGLNKNIDDLLKIVDYKNIQALTDVSKKIERSILTARISDEISRAILQTFKTLDTELVAVRSSATAEDGTEAAWAGQLESYVNVDEKNLIHNVKKCWGSFFTYRALRYRFKKTTNSETSSLAVVVQKMVRSESAGVAFSINPAKPHSNALVIEAGFGLGEAVVSGKITPDTYIVNRSPLTILEKTINKQKNYLSPQDNRWITLSAEKSQKQKLRDNDIKQLSQLVLAVEKHFSFPVDIEWALEKGSLFIVQARPITTIKKTGQYVWSNVNLAEVLPGVNPPLVTDYIIAGVEPAFRKMVHMEKDVPVIKVFNGRFYFNVTGIDSAIEKFFRIKNFSLMDFFGGENHKTKGKLLINIPFYMKLWLGIFVCFTVISSLFSKQKRRWHISSVNKKVTKLQKGSEEVHNIAHLLFLTKECRSFLFPAIIHGLESILSEISFYFAFAALSNKWLGEGKGNELLKSGEDELQFIQVFNELWNISRAILAEEKIADAFQATTQTIEAELILKQSLSIFPKYQNFLQKHGHRCVNELNFSIPRWVEDPTFIITILKKYMDAPEENSPFEKEKKTRLESQKKSKEVLQKLSWWKASILSALCKRAQSGLREREYLKSEVLRSFVPFRQFLLHIGNELKKQGMIDHTDDIFMLTSEEFDELSLNTIDINIIKERKKIYATYEGLSMPSLLDDYGTPIESVIITQNESEKVLKGIAVSAGIIKGKARIVTDIENISILETGEILVTDHTDPGWTPIFVTISGIVTNTGGLLSHAAIVAREYGLPAVVNVPNATQRIKDGEQIIVDGNTGIVTICT
ncbi:MAG: PEP/pyruvate-binding domain-containing protein [bacterium]